MAITATLNTTFAKLVDDRSLAVKQNAASREREAVCDIAIGASDTYVTGGITLNFSVIRQFKTVYYCEVVHKDLGLNMAFIPASGNDAATGKLKIWGTDGNELGSGSTLIQSKNLRVIIRGN